MSEVKEKSFEEFLNDAVLHGLPKEEKNKEMCELEKQEFERIICAMSEEEMKIAVAKIDEDILWDELRRRSTANRNKLQAVRDMVQN